MKKTMREIFTFINIMDKVTGVAIVNIHNEFNMNIKLIPKKTNSEMILFLVCDGVKILGYNYHKDMYRFSTLLNADFIEKVSDMVQYYLVEVNNCCKRDILKINTNHFENNLNIDEKKYLYSLKVDNLERNNHKNSYNKWNDNVELIPESFDFDDNDEILDIEVDDNTISITDNDLKVIFNNLDIFKRNFKQEIIFLGRFNTLSYTLMILFNLFLINNLIGEFNHWVLLVGIVYNSILAFVYCKINKIKIIDILGVFK